MFTHILHRQQICWYNEKTFGASGSHKFVSSFWNCCWSLHSFLFIIFLRVQLFPDEVVPTLTRRGKTRVIEPDTTENIFVWKEESKSSKKFREDLGRDSETMKTKTFFVTFLSPRLGVRGLSGASSWVLLIFSRNTLIGYHPLIPWQSQYLRFNCIVNGYKLQLSEDWVSFNSCRVFSPTRCQPTICHLKFNSSRFSSKIALNGSRPLSVSYVSRDLNGYELLQHMQWIGYRLLVRWLIGIITRTSDREKFQEHHLCSVNLDNSSPGDNIDRERIIFKLKFNNIWKVIREK